MRKAGANRLIYEQRGARGGLPGCQLALRTDHDRACDGAERVSGPADAVLRNPPGAIRPNVWPAFGVGVGEDPVSRLPATSNGEIEGPHDAIQ
jgi:hypothetical protein